MFRSRRNDLSPRLELTPLIDVVFLLLTFFIYSLVMMIRAEVLPVKLAALTAANAKTTAVNQTIQAITIDRQGALFFNRERMTLQQLEQRLGPLASQTAKPRLYLAMEDKGAIDRGPLLVNLISRLNAMGITDLVIVGEKP